MSEGGRKRERKREREGEGRQGGEGEKEENERACFELKKKIHHCIRLGR